MLLVEGLLSDVLGLVEHNADVLLFDTWLIDSWDDRISSAQNCRLFMPLNANHLRIIRKVIIMIVNSLICPSLLFLNKLHAKTLELRFRHVSRTFPSLFCSRTL